MTPTQHKTLTDADRNWGRFVMFRVLFNARFYYPVLAVLFLDLGLTATEYTLLNFAWALAIVFTDLPAGALADRIGRKPLVVAAAGFMVLEMILLAVAPRNGGLLLLLCCLANRVFSGMAEGMASGADEALVFDSLAERGRSDEWPKVLDQVMRWQAVGMVIAMLMGGAAYDPIFVTHFASVLGLDLHFTQDWTLRFPIYLTLVSSIAAFVLSLSLREPKMKIWHVTSEDVNIVKAELTAWNLVANAGSWILKTPAALFVIVAGVLIDSAVRIFLTLSSSYYRIIELPEASFGIIGAAFGGLGMVISPIARWMVAKNSLLKNYALIAAIVFMSLLGVAVRWNHWGVIFMLPLGGAFMALGFMVSYYLNAIVDSKHRATVLSFKGVAFNLGYGFISLVFALVLRAVRDGASTQEAVSRGLAFLPLWIVFAAIICAGCFGRQHQVLSAKV